MATRLGIDIGGTGIKGAPVDTDTGELIAERFRILTPQPGDARRGRQVVAEIATHFDWTGPIGATFPAVVQGRRGADRRERRQVVDRHRRRRAARRRRPARR